MPHDAHTLIDIGTTILLGIVGFFCTRLVAKQEAHDDRLNNHGQRLAKLDGEIERVA